MADKVSIEPLRRKATLLKKEVAKLEDAAGVGLVEKMQGEGERFNSKGKGLATKINMKVINTLLRLRENQLVASPRYNKLKDDLIKIQDKISGR